jgi:hypothetical protein
MLPCRAERAAFSVPAFYDVADFSPMPARIGALRRHIAEASFHRNATRTGKMRRSFGVGMSVPQRSWGA